jgi:cobyrinic acid a,c-diamide synthase
MNTPQALRGLIVAAPRSGSGKTVLTLGLLRALRRGGLAVASGKVGPDYIDPAFHAAATGRPCVSLDSWAMRPASLGGLVAGMGEAMGTHLAVVEGVMGLFDGAPVVDPLADGSTASLAALTGWPVVLVLDVTGQAASAAAVARGFLTHRPDVTVAAVVLNRVAGARHEDTLRRAFAATLPDLPVIGAVPRDSRLDLPHRHLGLIQASEHATLEGFLDAAADLVEAHVDMDALRRLAQGSRPLPTGTAPLLPPLGQRLAVARDVAYAFAYPAQLDAWQAAGVEVMPFSPLANEAPASDADSVFLPGGYPELHAGALAAAGSFLNGLRHAAARGAWVYGECGGFMTLGESLIDAQGYAHPMAGLLPLCTSFAERRLHLGYRRGVQTGDGPFGPPGTVIRGHEFHYATVVSSGSADCRPLFQADDAAGTPLGAMGLIRLEGGQKVSGSFLHAIDCEAPTSPPCNGSLTA